MHKKVAEYDSVRRSIEATMFDENDRFMYDLSHLPETLKRWSTYKKAKSPLKKESTINIKNLEKVLGSKKGGKSKIKEVEKVSRKRKVDYDQADDEEALDIGIKTKRILTGFDPHITYGKELKAEISRVKERVSTHLYAKLFDILFL